MEVRIQTIIKLYKEELAKLMNENILLRAQVEQLQNDSKDIENGDDE